jgi:hypothetical protein
MFNTEFIVSAIKNRTEIKIKMDITLILMSFFILCVSPILFDKNLFFVYVLKEINFARENIMTIKLH